MKGYIYGKLGIGILELYAVYSCLIEDLSVVLWIL